MKKLITLLTLPVVMLLLMAMTDPNWRSIGATRICDSDSTILNFESNGGVPVNLQDQTSIIVADYFLGTVGNPTTLAYDAVVNAYEVVLSGSYTLDSLDRIFMADVNRQFSCGVLDTSGDTVTLDSPIPYSFPASGTTIREVTTKLNVDGSGTRQVFTINNPTTSNVQWDITGIRLHITDNAAMDDGTFGALSALERGCTLQKKDSAGVYYHYGNFKTNGEFIEAWDNHEYNQKAPAGQYGFIATWKVAGQGNMGVSIRLSQGDQLIFTVADDLTGLLDMDLFVFGHYVTD